MNTLKYALEYHCYPVWNYDETGTLIDNDLPDELREDEELDSMLLKIQEIFDSLYVDTPREFSSKGFESGAAREQFLSLLFASVELIKSRYGEKYEVVCKYNKDSFSSERL